MNAIEFCKHVEAQLGWEAPAGADRRRYIPEAGKVKRRITTDPERFTWENLLLAVELLRKEKKSRSPIGVFEHVDRALDLALDTEVDVEADIREATRAEAAKGDPDDWVVRFSRATGEFRRRALDEYRRAQA